MALFFVLVCTLFSLVYSKTHLPGHSGPCEVQTRSVALNDTGRVDAFSPKHDVRSIMVSSFVPVHCGDTHYEPYIPAKFAQEASKQLGLPNDTVGHFDLPSYSTNITHQNSTKEYPVILFSPGLASSRLIYANLLEEVASAGFVVISMDHPYDAGAVQFPDGHVITMNTNITHNIQQALDTRVADARLTLDKLKKAPHTILPKFPGRLKLDRVSFIGHSLGGATAAQTLLSDTRFAGGINFDGALHGSVVKEGLDRPFINFGEPYESGQEPSWSEFWKHRRGFKLQLQLDGAKHLSFSDLPVLLDTAPNATALRNATKDVSGTVPGIGKLPGVGTLPGLRVKTILAEYITVASNFFITGKNSTLLHEPSPAYPEVQYIRK